MRITLALRGVPLAAALEQLVAASGISLQYDTRVVRRGAPPAPVYCRVDDAPPEALLSCIVREAGLDYYRLSSGTYVVIARAEEAPAYATLSGIVLDASSGSPLPQARIGLDERPDVRIANDAGSFAFGRLPPGSYRLSVQAIGYEPFRREVTVPRDGRVRERILLRRYAVLTTPIVVNGLQPGAASTELGGIRFAGDVATPLVLGPGLFMPGAPSALGLTRRDGVGDLHIQGGEAGEHVWRLDGVPIFDAATLAGVFGAFSPLAIDELKVRRAGYEARSGSFSAGVIDLAHGFGDRTLGLGVQSAAQVDPFSASLRLVVPASPRGTRITTMLSARTGLWDVYRPNALAQAIREWNVPDPVLLGRLTSAGRTLASDLQTTSRPYTIESGTTDVRLQDFHVASRAEIGAFQRLTASLYVGRHGVSTTTAAIPFLSPLERSSDVLLSAAERQSTRASDAYAWRTIAAQVRHEGLRGARVSHSVQLRGSEHALDHDYALFLGAAPLAQAPPRRDGNRVREFALVGNVQVAGGGAWNVDFGSEVAWTDAQLDL
ncbi:MAG TPA: carboxypeptidase regulatory-like domain-containing protein, partial [Gemmatimonadaceae bacterium]|nr:carboxypeptidase regulatory-like domain-containing protein [Gemmatimonadaceae bacterium]